VNIAGNAVSATQFLLICAPLQKSIIFVRKAVVPYTGVPILSDQRFTRRCFRNQVCKAQWAATLLIPSGVTSFTASWEPVDAPHGNNTQQRKPTSTITSSSTAELSREPRTSRATMSTMAVVGGVLDRMSHQTCATRRLLVVPAVTKGMPATMTTCCPRRAKPSWIAISTA
jgi:hypothetical protein